jgi:hypothetical protein
MPSETRTIAVTGDVSIDWLLLSSASEGRGAVDFIWMWGRDYICRALSSWGGAALHAEILRAVASRTELENLAVVGPTVPIEALASPFHPAYTHTFASLQRFAREKGEVGGRFSWRIARFLGTNPAREKSATTSDSPLQAVDTVMVVDHGLGFRHHPFGLTESLAAMPRYIVWETGAPLADSALADVLLSQHAEDLTVITSSDELRKTGDQVSYALSWEQLTEEILGAVRASPVSRARCVIVVVGAAGAVIIERNGEDTLVFDSRSQEGDWSRRHPGVGTAHGPCMDAAVAFGLTGGGEAALVDSVKRGLAAGRVAHKTGFVVDLDLSVRAEPFPLHEVARAIVTDTDQFASVAYRPAAGTSILAQTHGEGTSTTLAADVALHGIASLPPGIPVETAGAWASVDRLEIQGMRSVRNILEEYIKQRLDGGPLDRPLSVAVFGPPGSGKTFAVRQLATVLLPGQLRTLEYNLSQLHSVADLVAVFHELRDVALGGDLPLVFWDEFDAPLDGVPLGWLQHFLAPMEDGGFQEGASFHPLGGAVFVFAGGTASRFGDFIAPADQGAERAAKKPDFVSRLRGYLDVPGPNRQDAADVAFPLRRALLLRSLIGRQAPQMMRAGADEPQLDIDGGVLRAFLAVDEYIHGARSMQAIVEMSTLSGKPRFERSSLPARRQLALHVDAEAFLELVRG